MDVYACIEDICVYWYLASFRSGPAGAGAGRWQICIRMYGGVTMCMITYGCVWGLWICMDVYDIVWLSVDVYGCMVLHGCVWLSMVVYGCMDV